MSEFACPFCASALPADLLARPAPPRPPAGIGRAAIVAFGVAAAAALGCGGDNKNPEMSGPPVVQPTPTPTPPAPTPVQPAPPPVQPTPEDPGGPVAAYGAPMPEPTPPPPQPVPPG